MHSKSRLSVLPALCFALAALAVGGLSAAPAQAQECDTDWERPIVCEIELVASVRGESARSAVRDVLRLRPGTATILSVRPEDQFGKGFPAQRFAYEISAGSACNGLVAIDEERIGEIRLDAGSRAGSCELAILPANNLNVDRRITLEVVAGAAPAPAPAPGGVQQLDRASILAGWLYQGLLGRAPEAEARAATAAEIRAGRVEAQVESILRSAEFRTSRQGLSAAQLLDRIYQGLLGRAPDAAGSRSYTDDILRGDIADVVEELLDSREMQERLARAAAEPRR